VKFVQNAHVVVVVVGGGDGRSAVGSKQVYAGTDAGADADADADVVVCVCECERACEVESVE
jgi:hypothetical protein